MASSTHWTNNEGALEHGSTLSSAGVALEVEVEDEGEQNSSFQPQGPRGTPPEASRVVRAVVDDRARPAQLWTCSDSVVELALQRLEAQRTEHQSPVASLNVLHVGCFGERAWWLGILKECLSVYTKGELVFLTVVCLQGRAHVESDVMNLAATLGVELCVIEWFETTTYETPALVFLHTVCSRTNEFYRPYLLVNYHHTKAVTHENPKDVFQHWWRRLMLWGTSSRGKVLRTLLTLEWQALVGRRPDVAQHWQTLFQEEKTLGQSPVKPWNLQEVACWDAAGTALVRHNEQTTVYQESAFDTTYFAGNFWQARAHYLATLPFPGLLDRMECETWLGFRRPRAIDSAMLQNDHFVLWDHPVHRPFSGTPPLTSACYVFDTINMLTTLNESYKDQYLAFVLSGGVTRAKPPPPAVLQTVLTATEDAGPYQRAKAWSLRHRRVSTVGETKQQPVSSAEDRPERTKNRWFHKGDHGEYEIHAGLALSMVVTVAIVFCAVTWYLTRNSGPKGASSGGSTAAGGSLGPGGPGGPGGPRGPRGSGGPGGPGR